MILLEDGTVIDNVDYGDEPGYEFFYAGYSTYHDRFNTVVDVSGESAIELIEKYKLFEKHGYDWELAISEIIGNGCRVTNITHKYNIVTFGRC